MKNYLRIGLAVVALFAVFAGIGFFAYWQYLKTTPQYSLASLIDAAKRDDANRVEQLVDSDAVVDDMLPQVMAKAVDRYGRGVSPALVARAVLASTPFMPAVKQRVRPEVWNLIRKETEGLSATPFPLLVLGADRYLDVRVDGDTAVVRKRNTENPGEIRMERNGTGWKVTGVRDEKFAGEIAQRFGQEILSLTSGKNGIDVNSIVEQLQGPIQ